MDWLDLNAGYPFWLIKDGLLFNYPTLFTNKKTTVAILGGGITGALIAWKLISNNIGCVVLDGRAIGLGSTCASTSLLQYEIDVPLCELQNKVGLQNAVRSYKLCLESINELKDIAKETGCNDFEKKQSLYYAANKKHIDFLQEEYSIRKKHGFKVEILNETDVKKSFGFTAPAAILSKEAAQTNAYLLTHRLLQAGIKKGLEVYSHTSVVDIKHNKRGVILKTENGLIVKADKMVYATGYEVVKYINKPIVKLLSTFATVSEQVETETALLNKETMLWNTADPYLYIRTTSDNRVLVGGRDEDFYNPTKRDKLIKTKATQLSKDFIKIFPRIPFKNEFSWAGTFGSTKDGLPFIGKYKALPHGYFALGFGGNGITFSQVAANIIYNQVKGKIERDATIFSFERI